MSYSCKILLDSISETGKRLTTFEITFPRIVLSEFNTHRMFSRNSASSRAIPFSKQIEKVKTDPFIPEQFPLNCTGMQPQEYVTKDDSAYKYYVDYWLGARNNAVSQAVEFFDLKKPHKQIVNRLIEPFMWHTVIVTATEFSNFFKLRCDENAQYEIRRIADLMYEAYYAFDSAKIDNCDLTDRDIKVISNHEWIAIRPQKLKVGEWHCPLVSYDDFKPIMLYLSSVKELDEPNAENWTSYSSLECKSWNNGSAEDILNAYIEVKKKISVARCARVSYLTHDGKRDIEKDLELFEKLRASRHWSPFEHVATPLFYDNGSQYSGVWDEEEKANRKLHTERYCNERSGNFIGWKQMRKEFTDENCTNFKK